jgi:hypothetical protein
MKDSYSYEECTKLGPDRLVKSGEEESYPLEQIVVCLGLDILQERINDRRKAEEDEGQ